MSWLKWIKPRKKIKVIEECKQLHSFWHEWTQEPSPSNLIKIIEALLSEENHLMLPTLKQTFRAAPVLRVVESGSDTVALCHAWLSHDHYVQSADRPTVRAADGSGRDL